MALRDLKISSETMAEKGVIAAPDTLVGSAADNKAIFDRLVRAVVEQSLNPLLDSLSDPGGAGEIGAAVAGLSGDTVAEVLAAVKAALDTKVSGEPGQGLSEQNYTLAEKNKLAGVAAGANCYVLPAATEISLGGVKQGQGVEIMPDGTIHGLSAPAPDLVARQEIADHSIDSDIHVTAAEKAGWSGRTRLLTVTLPAEDWVAMTPGEIQATYEGLAVRQAVSIPGLGPGHRVDIDSVPVVYQNGGQPQLWPFNMGGVCIICAVITPEEDVTVKLSVQEVTAI